MLAQYGRALFLGGLLWSCASTDHGPATQLRQLVASKNYDQALGLTDRAKLYTEKQSQLLKLLERGRLHHLRGDGAQSLETFHHARELSDRLYTQSIGKKIESVLVNDRADNYYGEKYERSLIRFYQALGHFVLAREAPPEERQRHLQSARAVLLEWDSLLDDYRGQLAGEAIYKDDLLAKLFGAIVHQSIGGRNEINTARQLYKDAGELLLKNYSAYPSYNQKHREFGENFEQFPQLGLDKVRRDYIAPTPLAQELENYIEKCLQALKKGPGPMRGRVHVLVSESTIRPKQARKIDFPIVLASLPLGITNRRDFASYVSTTLGFSGLAKPTISFELPGIEESANIGGRELLVLSTEKAIVHREPLALAAPLSEIARQSLEYRMAAIKAKTGLRVAGKHLAALGSSYLAYRSALKSGQPDFMATLATVGLYTLASHKIDQSERADLRHWATLPHNIWLASFDLPPGQYTLAVADSGRRRELGELSIEAVQKRFFYAHF